MDSCWEWLKISEEDKRMLVAVALEIAVYFFFTNFVYTFGGNSYAQSSGGPIGAHLTMAVSILIIQPWYEEFERILK